MIFCNYPAPTEKEQQPGIVTIQQRRRCAKAAILSGSEARQQEERPVELDSSRVGRLSRMDAMQQQAMAQATKPRLDVELNQITSALTRIAAGEYGYCVSCGEEIAKGRLMATLTTLTCITCATEAEKK